METCIDPLPVPGLPHPFTQCKYMLTQTSAPVKTSSWSTSSGAILDRKTKRAVAEEALEEDRYRSEADVQPASAWLNVSLHLCMLVLLCAGLCRHTSVLRHVPELVHAILGHI